MICIRTRDDWTTATIDVDDGMGAQTWTPAATVRDAYAASLDLIAWMLSTFGDVTTVVYDASGDAAKMTFTAQSAYDWVPSSAAASLLGASPSSSEELEWSAPSGTVSVLTLGETGTPLTVPSLVSSQPYAVASVGSIATNPIGEAASRSTAALSLSPERAAYLRQALAAARNPRTAAILRAYDSTWVEVALGRVTTSHGARARVRADFEVWS